MNNDSEKVSRAIMYLLLLGKYIPADTTFAEMCGDILVARDIEGRAIELVTGDENGTS